MYDIQNVHWQGAVPRHERNSVLSNDSSTKDCVAAQYRDESCSCWSHRLPVAGWSFGEIGMSWHTVGHSKTYETQILQGNKFQNRFVINDGR